MSNDANIQEFVERILASGDSAIIRMIDAIDGEYATKLRAYPAHFRADVIAAYRAGHRVETPAGREARMLATLLCSAPVVNTEGVRAALPVDAPERALNGTALSMLFMQVSARFGDPF
ncbi:MULTISPECIES: hypothetical protein [unclassified Paraburkholderia]|uniref:hypothetical protein n=1 Tax=unclassified Paraburkholderia TaxID=2615204 RepID=UPI002AB0F466|nr:MULTISPECIES: hypothetical protein [unclassified Paraburkholderia]